MASIFADYPLTNSWDFDMLNIDPETIVSYDLDGEDLIVEYRDPAGQSYKVKYFATQLGMEDYKWVFNNPKIEQSDWEMSQQPKPRPREDDDMIV
jgi:hypothetical protein